MSEKERREALPEQSSDKAEGSAGEDSPGPMSAWEGYSLETLSALFDY